MTHQVTYNSQRPEQGSVQFDPWCPLIFGSVKETTNYYVKRHGAVWCLEAYRYKKQECKIFVTVCRLSHSSNWKPWFIPLDDSMYSYCVPSWWQATTNHILRSDSQLLGSPHPWHKINTCQHQNQQLLEGRTLVQQINHKYDSYSRKNYLRSQNQPIYQIHYLSLVYTSETP